VSQAPPSHLVMLVAGKRQSNGGSYTDPLGVSDEISNAPVDGSRVRHI
jgi:hypothetical protein